MAISRVCITTSLVSTTFFYVRKPSQGGTAALDVWPELAIAIQACNLEPWQPRRMQILVANIIAALKQHNRHQGLGKILQHSVALATEIRAGVRLCAHTSVTRCYDFNYKLTLDLQLNTGSFVIRLGLSSIMPKLVHYREYHIQ